jgi:hypothetical protein
LRDFIGENIHIDGRMIPYRLVTSTDYFEAKNYSEKEIDGFFESEVADLVGQIMGLKQSCYLLRHTSHSCQSLSDGLYDLKLRLIHELKDKFSFEFDDDFVENYGF